MIDTVAMLVPPSVTFPDAVFVAPAMVVDDMELFWHFKVFSVAVPLAADSGMSSRPRTGSVELEVGLDLSGRCGGLNGADRQPGAAAPG